jgi:hypothetical protein
MPGLPQPAHLHAAAVAQQLRDGNAVRLPREGVQGALWGTRVVGSRQHICCSLQRCSQGLLGLHRQEVPAVLGSTTLHQVQRQAVHTRRLYGHAVGSVGDAHGLW